MRNKALKLMPKNLLSPNAQKEKKTKSTLQVHYSHAIWGSQAEMTKTISREITGI